ncbi:MAG: hypothetical protein KAS16_05925 [Thermoplasmata archaeon]|nr:hypothetical protein [Thermoplasmata archaeon]
MIKIIGIMSIFGGLGFLGLGFIFIVAGGSSNLRVGGACIGLGLVLLLLTYFLVKMESKRPTLVHQDINVQMSGSGEFKKRDIACPSCGAPVKDENIKLIDGGLMINCPFCEKVSALEEEPKW